MGICLPLYISVVQKKVALSHHLFYAAHNGNLWITLDCHHHFHHCRLFYIFFCGLTARKMYLSPVLAYFYSFNLFDSVKLFALFSTFQYIFLYYLPYFYITCHIFFIIFHIFMLQKKKALLWVNISVLGSLSPLRSSVNLLKNISFACFLFGYNIPPYQMIDNISIGYGLCDTEKCRLLTLAVSRFAWLW